MNKRTMSAFEKGYHAGRGESKSIKANVSNLMKTDTVQARWRTKASILGGVMARIIPDWLHDMTGLGSDGGERITKKELARLANNLEWAHVELANAGDVTDGYAREAQIASAELGRAFGRLTQIVKDYQADLSNVAPTAWNAYPELLNYKVVVLDNLLKQMLPLSKVVDLAEGMEQAFTTLSDDIDDQHEGLLEAVAEGFRQNGYELPPEYYELFEY